MLNYYRSGQEIRKDNFISELTENSVFTEKQARVLESALDSYIDGCLDNHNERIQSLENQ